MIAGLANSSWSALIALASIPFYLKYLGVEAYGIIGFFATMQALLQLLDMGMAPTINREVARCTAAGKLKEATNLLHSLAIIYWLIAGAIALSFVAFAPLIAKFWLKSQTYSVETVSNAIMYMGLVAACRWPIGLYQGALMGSQRIVLSSSINMTMITIGNVGAIVVIAFISPTLTAFFTWQAITSISHAFIIRYAAWKIIGSTQRKKFDYSSLKNIWKFTAGMSAISLMGMIYTQLDKIILSKFLDLEQFAHYMLASTVVNGLYLLITPVYNAAYPQFSSMVVSGDRDLILQKFRLYTRIVLVFLIPAAVLLIAYPENIIEIWTGNLKIANSVAPIISLLAAGVTLNGIMMIPHALQLAYGMTRLPIIINGVLMIFILPLIIYLSLSRGAIGGALAWLVMNISYVIFSTWLTNKKVLHGKAVAWVTKDVALPILIVALITVLIKITVINLNLSTYGSLATGIISSICFFIVALHLTPELSIPIKKTFHRYILNVNEGK
ncbi:oligosaccharide flippase family protein [Methylovorus sp. MP688]|uniref:oligosaccharide flippase family protein n=1 Tax=Methylovorus sp. (strain MP688) TaxID=887061 RepID=UPI00143C9C67|nr:oligosaccharide flippase family protein [Methylovorus sp. MP688]